MCDVIDVIRGRRLRPKPCTVGLFRKHPTLRDIINDASGVDKTNIEPGVNEASKLTN